VKKARQPVPSGVRCRAPDPGGEGGGSPLKLKALLKFSGKCTGIHATSFVYVIIRAK